MNQREPSEFNSRKVLTEREAAAALGVSYPTLCRYRRDGHPLCAYFQPSPRRVCYLVSDIEKARAKRRTPEGADGEVAAAVTALAASESG